MKKTARLLPISGFSAFRIVSDFGFEFFLLHILASWVESLTSLRSLQPKSSAPANSGLRCHAVDVAAIIRYLPIPHASGGVAKW
jgi:hypothetical protein